MSIFFFVFEHISNELKNMHLSRKSCQVNFGKHPFPSHPHPLSRSKLMRLTLADGFLGLGIALGHSSSLTRCGRVGGVGVNGWKLDVGVIIEPGGVASSSL